jgi:hypothetical protein
MAALPMRSWQGNLLHLGFCLGHLHTPLDHIPVQFQRDYSMSVTSNAVTAHNTHANLRLPTVACSRTQTSKKFRIGRPPIATIKKYLKISGGREMMK